MLLFFLAIQGKQGVRGCLGMIWSLCNSSCRASWRTSLSDFRLFFAVGIYISCSDLTDGEPGLWRMGWDLRWCSRTVAGLCEAPRAASRRSGYLKVNLWWPQTPQLPFRKQSRHWEVSHCCGRHIFSPVGAPSTEGPAQHCYNNYTIHFQTDSHEGALWVSWGAIATYEMIRKVFI